MGSKILKQCHQICKILYVKFDCKAFHSEVYIKMNAILKKSLDLVVKIRDILDLLC